MSQQDILTRIQLAIYKVKLTLLTDPYSILLLGPDEAKAVEAYIKESTTFPASHPFGNTLFGMSVMVTNVPGINFAWPVEARENAERCAALRGEAA